MNTTTNNHNNNNNKKNERFVLGDAGFRACGAFFCNLLAFDDMVLRIFNNNTAMWGLKD